MKSPLSILLVEDDLVILEGLASLMKHRFQAVWIAENGADSLELALFRHPDIIMTDYNMPKMNGLQMVQVLRAKGLEMPVIFHTSEGDSELLDQMVRTPQSYLLPKPSFYETVSEALMWSEKICQTEVEACPVL